MDTAEYSIAKTVSVSDPDVALSGTETDTETGTPPSKVDRQDPSYWPPS
jgi:hypothetical protein